MLLVFGLRTDFDAKIQKKPHHQKILVVIAVIS